MSFLKAILYLISYIILRGTCGVILVLLYFALTLETVVPKTYHIDAGMHLLMLGVVVLWLKKQSAVSFSRNPHRLPLYIALGLLLGLGCVFVQIPLNRVYNLFGATGGIQHFPESFDFTWFTTNPLLLLGSVLIIPVTEELFFRTLLQKKLSLKYTPLAGILGTAILFGALHINWLFPFEIGETLGLRHAYITFFGGLISGTLYQQSKSVLPSIVFHVCWNFMVYT